MPTKHFKSIKRYYFALVEHKRRTKLNTQIMIAQIKAVQPIKINCKGLTPKRSKKNSKAQQNENI